jgi:hypothetical protein
MASDSEHCTKALGTHVWESFKDFGQRAHEEPGVEDVHIYPLDKKNGFEQTTLSITRKGDPDDSSIVFACTDTGSMLVSMFVAGVPLKSPAAPSIVTREWVDEMVEKFIRTLFARPTAP